ncbi:MAG: response regulator transcription factor [Candidatus Dormibacteraceae bacterium]
MRILIVEDDRRLAAVLRRGLQEEGYGVDLATEGDYALAAVAATDFDALVLDVMLPGARDGFQICAELRRENRTLPVLMLTGRDAVQDRVQGLDAGADDYLVKPFAFAELLARLRALTRRHGDAGSSVLEAGLLALDRSAHRVCVKDHEVKLTGKEFAILEYLMHHPNRVLSKAQIEEHVWDYDFDAESNLVEVYIARLRSKLIKAGLADDPFTTLRGFGYRFALRD